MNDDHEKCLKQCGLIHKQWHRDHCVWLEEFQHWKNYEQKVVGIIFELENTLPGHRTQLNRLNKLVQDHEQQLEKHVQNFGHVRETFVDDKCPAELEDMKRLRLSRCQSCEPMCIEALMESHRQAVIHHEQVSCEYTRLKAEYEPAVTQLRELTNRLLACLNRSE